MTRLQRLITHTVTAHGYYLINTREQKRTRQVVDAYMAHRPDLTYYWTGGYVAIAQSSDVAEMVVTWANTRHMIRIFDNTSYWHREAILRDAEKTTAWRLKLKEKRACGIYQDIHT